MSTVFPPRMASPAMQGGGGMGLGSGAGPNSGVASATTTLFRRLIWEGSVPLEIRIDQKELPADSDRGLGESYYLQVPRISYLPLIVPELKQYLIELVLSEREAANVKEDVWWFEDEYGSVVKWHWPIGLLYDIYVTSKTVSLAANLPPTATVSTPQPNVHPQPTVPLRLTLHLAPMGGSEKQLPGTANTEALKQTFMSQLKEADFLRWGSTKRVTGLRKNEQDGMWDALRDRKNVFYSDTAALIDALVDNFEDFWRVASKITPSPVVPPMPTSPSSFHNPTYHSRPPSTDPGMGNATSLPPQDRDTAYNVRSIPIRIYLPDLPHSGSAAGSPRGGNVPLPGSTFSNPGGAGSGSTFGTGIGSSMSPFHPHLTGGTSLATYASTLPGGAGTSTVIQPLVPPLLLDGASSQSSAPSGITGPGSPQLVSSPLATTGSYGPGGSLGGSAGTSSGGQPITLRHLMEQHLGLLFPSKRESTGGATLAHAIVQGVVVPLETELAWLGACMSGADGWVSVVVGLGKGA
ncbi:autophagy protein 5 [Serendipita sp. 399]|nr:autophagy protein 5 [Serendipita sp. 399]